MERPKNENNSGYKIVFISERDGTKRVPRSTERQEHSRNDPHCWGKGTRTVASEGRTVHDVESFGFSFLSFEPRSSFGGQSLSFQKRRRFWNDPRTRSERRGRSGKSGMISPFKKSNTQKVPHFRNPQDVRISMVVPWIWYSI